MPVTNPEDGQKPDIITIKDPRAIIIEIARARREAHRVANAFGDLPSKEHFDATMAQAVKGTADLRTEVEEALALLEEEKRELIAALPALETSPGYPTSTTATERFEAFFVHDEFLALDLKRFENVGDWSGADVLDAEVDELITALENTPGFTVTRFEVSPETCVMHMSSQFYPEQLKSGKLYLARNTKKAEIEYDGKKICINKRTEFVVDMHKLELAQRLALYNAMGLDEENYQNEEQDDDIGMFFLEDALFAEYNTMIGERHPAVEPINSTAYAFRVREPKQSTLIIPSPQLADMPEVTKAWIEVHAQEAGFELPQPAVDIETRVRAILYNAHERNKRHRW